MRIDNDQAQSLQPGIYEHFKGGRYRVLGIARHSESQDEFVVYESLEQGGMWIRPLGMFMENVEREGKTVKRFEKYEE